MKKNRTMRAATLLLALTLMTSTFVSGTFAKYVTSASGSDKARVAHWGFRTDSDLNATTFTLDNLFLSSYDGDGDTSVTSQNGEDVIAPGTSGSASFVLRYDNTANSTLGDGSVDLNMTGPEVAYTFTVDVEESIDGAIETNPNIQWKLDSGAWGEWDDMIDAIKLLSGEADGSCDYAPGDLPSAFGSATGANDDVTGKHTISWQWIFVTADDAGTTDIDEMAIQDAADTLMGNTESLDDCSITITVTATQLDTYTAP